MESALTRARACAWDAKMEQLEQALDFSMAQIHVLQTKIEELQSDKQRLLRELELLRQENERLLIDLIEPSSSATSTPEKKALSDSWELLIDGSHESHSLQSQMAGRVTSHG